jgi:hypothetical protein
MTEGFYNKFLGFFVGFIALLILVFATLEIMLLFLITKNVFLGYAYYAVFFFSLGYGIIFFKKYRDFQSNMYLLFPKTENKLYFMEKPEKIDLDIEDLTLQVCAAYHNGDSLAEITRKFGLNHPTTAQRDLQKGLGFLLKFYRENKGEKT